jgi:hypothetical protein
MTPISLWYLGEWVKLIATLVAAFGGVLAALKAVSEWRRATLQRAEELDQRKREFRQKQAVFARDIIKDIFADERAFNALTMLDFPKYRYKDPEKKKQHYVRREDLRPALVAGIKNQDKENFIRRSFEGLYDHLEQIQNLLDVGVINLDDIDTTFAFYMRRALEDDIEHLKFLDEFEYPKTKRFMTTLASLPPRS